VPQAVTSSHPRGQESGPTTHREKIRKFVSGHDADQRRRGFNNGRYIVFPIWQASPDSLSHLANRAQNANGDSLIRWRHGGGKKTLTRHKSQNRSEPDADDFPSGVWYRRATGSYSAQARFRWESEPTSITALASRHHRADKHYVDQQRREMLPLKLTCSTIVSCRNNLETSP